jgi:formylglycine-generating enzyme required for sulfatase activity
LPPERVLTDTRQRVIQATLQILTAAPPLVEPRLRSRLGLALGTIGDPRLKPGETPELVPIPVGRFRMGTSPEDAENLKAQKVEPWGDESPHHPVFVSEFDIGKCPVTNAEFHAFVEAKGYEKEQYWSPNGWRWRMGTLEVDLSFLSDEHTQDVYRRWLEGRPAEKRNQPFFWDDPQRSAPNLPVVGVSWFEAEAYCKWLTAVTRQAFRLPTEAEWEKAARGKEGRLWPWGNEWDPNKCNSSEAKLGGATPVGTYPDGASPYGVLDMVGNVWEWCADWWDAEAYEKRKGEDVRDPTGPESGSARVVRGGAWSYDRRSCRAACRSWREPAGFDDFLGFRVVRAPVRS